MFYITLSVMTVITLSVVTPSLAILRYIAVFARLKWKKCQMQRTYMCQCVNQGSLLSFLKQTRKPSCRWQTRATRCNV